MGISVTERTDRQRTRPDQETELQNRSRLQEIPQDVALHPGRRQRTGEAADAQHQDPGADRQEAPAPRARRNQRLLRRGEGTQFTTRSRRATSASSSTKTRRRSKRPGGAEKDDSAASWKKVARSTPKTRPRKPTAACRRAHRRTPRRAAGSGHLQRARRASSKARSRPPAATTSSRSKIDAGKSPAAQRGRSPDQIQLEQQAQQESFTAFVADYASKWQSRTFCASGYVIERCANFKGTGPSRTAPAGLLRSEPERRAAGSLPGAGPSWPGAARHGHARSTARASSWPSARSPAGLKPAGEEGAALPKASRRRRRSAAGAAEALRTGAIARPRPRSAVGRIDWRARECHRLHPRPPDPRLARQPDGRGRGGARVRRRGRAAVPSGASTGEFEAVELRDGGDAWAARASRARSPTSTARSPRR